MDWWVHAWVRWWVGVRVDGLVGAWVGAWVRGRESRRIGGWVRAFVGGLRAAGCDPAAGPSHEAGGVRACVCVCVCARARAYARMKGREGEKKVVVVGGAGGQMDGNKSLGHTQKHRYTLRACACVSVGALIYRVSGWE